MKRQVLARWKRQRFPMRNSTQAALVAVLFAVAGYGLLGLGGAATFATVKEAETGTIAGNAGVVASPAASQANAILFGTGVPAAPTNLITYTGGDSIALRWDPAKTLPNVTINRYDIFRDNMKVASVNPTVYNPLFPDRFNSGYIDKAVTAGRTYKYQVQAFASNGQVSAFSTALNATHPTNRVNVPTITADGSGDPTYSATLQNEIVPMLKVWYPKLVMAAAHPDYSTHTSISIRLDTRTEQMPWASVAGNLLIYYTNHGKGHTKYKIAEVWLHEAMHIVQAYPSPEPGWVTEGYADYMAKSVVRSVPFWIPTYGNRSESYLNGYDPSAALINYIAKTYAPTFPRQANIAMHKRTYSDNLVRQATGKTYAQLWEEFKAATYTIAGTKEVRTPINTCLITQGRVKTAGTYVEGNTCDGSMRWVMSKAPGSSASAEFQLTIENTNLCLDMPYSSQTPGDRLWIYTCNGSSAQSFKRGLNGSVIQVNSELCLETQAAGNVTRIIQNTCNDGAAQRQWQLPDA